MTDPSRVSPRTRFALPPGVVAAIPPERRGIARDEVRLLVSSVQGIEHTRFRELPTYLNSGDLVVVNTSATLPAALEVTRLTQPRALMHVAGELDDGSWVVELRRPRNDGPAGDVVAGEEIALADGVQLRVQASYPMQSMAHSRLWTARVDPPVDRVSFLTAHGHPIRYGYVEGHRSLNEVQTVYADQPGSAEMPSAGRPFTDGVLRRLITMGVTVAPVMLHTGVSSPEKHEPPTPEPFAVPAATANLVNLAAAVGNRVVAVGTTVVRALESAADEEGTVTERRGWTDLVIRPGRHIRVVSGLITGLHEPEASHLLLLEAVAGAEPVAVAYRAAVARRYRWHEFGDSMLFLP